MMSNKGDFACFVWAERRAELEVVLLSQQLPQHRSATKNRGRLHVVPSIDFQF
jgi:hypothetical protein